MCGIVAHYGRADDELACRMLSRLEHRGPDDSGWVALEGGWLGHRRLAIVDVAGGHQPLANEVRDRWLVGNGEVYNHEGLRSRLRGVRFQTASDNEVLLHLVDRWGPDALSQVNGMFAFVVGGDGWLLAARDPVGIKPLYWAWREQGVSFASEIGAFDSDWQPHVEVFPPGHYWTPAAGLVRFACAVPRAVQKPPPSRERGHERQIPDQVLDETRDVLVASVERQMMGDVPVGVFLSGGLDSSLVAAIAQRYLRARGARLKTFAVGLEGSPDLRAAAAAAEHLGSEHHARVYTAEEAKAVVPEVIGSIESFDPSLVRSAVPNYLLARFTAEHVKVVLTGEGADELYSGYEYLCEFRDPDELHAELVRSVEGLHNLNLQRCDRVTMAHGLEARVPFLDREVIESALGVDPALKLRTKARADKHLLRSAFEGWLPEQLLWRGKSQFGDGSGAASVLTGSFGDSVSEREFEQERTDVSPCLRTREEVAYFRIFREYLAGVRPERTLGRFATA